MTDKKDTWKIFHLDLLGEAMEGSPVYEEFLRVPSMSIGLYRLPAGSKDMQGPHDEDEVYYVIEGKARVRVEGEEHVVGKGVVLYVKASSEHSFFEIEEDMTLLVMFASRGRGLP